MNLGKLEISTPTIVYAAILLALLIVVPSMVLSRMGAMRESMRRDVIVNAESQGGESLAEGITACRDMIAADPKKVAPRLHLGCLLAASKNYADARKEFEAAAELVAATPEEKSLAMVGAGSAASLDGVTDKKPKNLDDAQRLFQKALEYKDTPDALAALALVKSWKVGSNAPEVEALVAKAFAAEPAPAPALLEELYKLNGVILAKNHKPAEASRSYGSVKALEPANTAMDDIARLTTLSALNEASLTPAARRDMIQKMTQELDKFGKLRNEALLAIGSAWHMLQSEKDYLSKGGAFEKSTSTFKLVLEINSKEIRAYRSLNALYEERIQALAATLPVPISGLKGETLWTNPWDSAAVRSASFAADTAPLSSTLQANEQENLKSISALLRDEQLNWERMLASGDLERTERINAQMRLVACARRRVLLAPWLKTLRRDDSLNVIPENSDVELLKQAVSVASDWAAADDTGRGFHTLGLVQIERGEFAAARNALAEAAKHGFKSEEQSKLFDALTVKPKMVDAGPNVAERQFGTVPLIRAAFESPLGIGAQKLMKVSINGKEVPATILGSQVLYIPNSSEVDGGTHTVHFAANDASGAPMEFPDFRYSIDKEPPTWSVEPNPAGGPVKPDVIFNVTVADPSGVDWASLNMGINTAQTAAAPLNALLIKDGKYTHGILALKIKGGEAIQRAPFRLVPPNPYAPGEYTMSIDVRDHAGNKLHSEKPFVVK